MDTRTRLSLAVLPLMVGLAACGGGGGGGGSSATLSGFTSWSAVRSPSTTTVTGIGQQVSYTAPDGYVATVSDPSATGTASFTQVLDANGYVTRGSISTSEGTSITFDALRGDGFANYSEINLAANQAGTEVAVSAAPEVFGWDYQSFGAWITGGGLGAGKAGVVSVGAVTPAGAVPSTGTAVYHGGFGGIYVDSNGYDSLAAGNFRADVDFGNRSVQLTGSSAVTTDLISSTSAPHLNFSGSASYAAGSNRFEGTLTTAGGLTGATTGQFYGPQAQELGGVATLTSGTSVETFGVAYGAKR